MIKKLTLAMLLASGGIFGQTTPSVRKCGTMEHMEHLKQQNPALERQLKEYNETLKQQITTKTKGSQSLTAGRTIPVVVHVLYNTTSQNISDAQILSQLKVLNEDFSRTNADTIRTPDPFKKVAGSPNIQFCLAQRDPSGKATTGIVRVKTVRESFNDDDAMKSASEGGDDPWDVTRYFNIWVCNFTKPDLLGYGEMPTTIASSTFGYVGHYKNFGTTSNVVAPFNKGRIATHEIGHCFNLLHIFDYCRESDGCPDTPLQATASTGKPFYPLRNGCSNAPEGAMFMNFMDFSDDEVLNMFTVDQSDRMDAVLTNPPYDKLFSSNGCAVATGIDEESNSYKLNVYPNPNDGNFTLSFNVIEKSDYQIELKNALGQSVYRQTVNNFVGDYSKALNLEKYGKGVYTICISNNLHQAVQKMIIY